MAILIKGMEMPESCFLCRFCRRQEYGEYVGEDTAWSCVASKKRITDGQDLIATFKHPDCPLVEVPDTQTEKKSLNGDVIDRQAAIDAINSHFGFNIEEEYGSAVQEVINGLPSAQPEIIRCKDCMYFDKGWCNLDTSMGMSDFCSRAKRRTDE